MRGDLLSFGGVVGVYRENGGEGGEEHSLTLYNQQRSSSKESGVFMY